METITKIAIINNRRDHVGITRYSVDLFHNIKNNNISVEMYQLFYSIKQPDVHNFPGLNFHFKYSEELNNFIIRFYTKSLKKMVNAPIIHLCDPSMSSLVKAFPNAFLTVHDLYFLNNVSNSRIASAFWKRSYKKIDSFMNILADSEFTKGELVNKLHINENKINVLYPYIDTNKFHKRFAVDRNQLGFQDKDFILLNVAYDSPNKNLRFLYNLMLKLPNHYKLLRIGYNRPQNIEYVRKKGLGSRVKFLGYVDDTSLLKCYSSSDIFIYPSNYEGFGYGPLEAMAFGLPVICSNIPIFKEVLSEYGVLIDNSDPEKWIDSILSFSDKDLYNLYSIKSTLKVRDFSREAQLTKLETIYKKVEPNIKY